MKPLGVVTAAVGVARAALLVADPVQGREHLLAELRRLPEDRLDHIGRGVGEARQVVVALEVEDVVEEEQSILDGGLVARHRLLGSADVPASGRRSRFDRPPVSRSFTYKPSYLRKKAARAQKSGRLEGGRFHAGPGFRRFSPKKLI